MRPQPTLRAAFRSALASSCGQSCASRQDVASPFPQNAAAPSRVHSLTKTTTTTSHFSTSARSQDAQSSSSSPSSSTSSSPSAPPVLPASVLSQLIFSSSSQSAAAAVASSATPSPTPAVSVTSSNPSVYATVQIHGRPYLVTPGDSVRLPFKMPGVQPGDELVLNRVGVVGNRTVTAVASKATNSNPTENYEVPYVPGASVKAVVLGVESEPLRTMIKTKRRQRKKKTVKSKHRYTVLRIQEVCVEQ